MRAISTLGVGPLSEDIIEAVYEHSAQTRTPLMLISSKNQVDYDKGYVFHTAQYRQYLDRMKQTYPAASVYVCRDHCGPGHNSVFDIADSYKTIDADVEAGFDLIHIDFCLYPGGYDRVLAESRRAIEYLQAKSPDTLIEVGTDENTGTNVEDAARAEEQMKFFTSFAKPHFIVLQTGTVIKELRQEGIFHEDYIKKLRLLADTYNVAIKEHNADYLSAAEIQRRRGIVDAVNVAPQFGVLQTQLTLLRANQYGLDVNEFLDVSYRSRKWEKWLLHHTASNEYLCSVIAGHYNFRSDAYRRLYEGIMNHENFSQTIRQSVQQVLHLYVTHLSADLVGSAVSLGASQQHESTRAQ